MKSFLTHKINLLWIALTGILLPCVVRIPGGIPWVAQLWQEPHLASLAFFHTLNAIGWLPVLLAARIAGQGVWDWPPLVTGDGFLALAYATLDLSADAQAAIAWLFIPLISIPFTFAALALGCFLRWLTTNYEIRWK